MSGKASDRPSILQYLCPLSAVVPPDDSRYAFIVPALIDELQPYASRMWTSASQRRFLDGLRTIKRRVTDDWINEPWDANEIEAVVLLSSAVTAIAGTELRVATTRTLQTIRNDRLRSKYSRKPYLADELRLSITSAVASARLLNQLTQTLGEDGDASETAASTSPYRPSLPKRSATDALDLAAVYTLREHTSGGNADDEADLQYLSTFFDQVESERLDHLRTLAQLLERHLLPFLSQQGLYVYLKTVIESKPRPPTRALPITLDDAVA